MLKMITSWPTSNDPPFLPSSLLPPQTLTLDDLPTYLEDMLPLPMETLGSDCEVLHQGLEPSLEHAERAAKKFVQIFP